MSASLLSNPFIDKIQRVNRVYRVMKVKISLTKKVEKISRDVFLSDGDDKREDRPEKPVPKE